VTKLLSFRANPFFTGIPARHSCEISAASFFTDFEEFPLVSSESLSLACTKIEEVEQNQLRRQNPLLSAMLLTPLEMVTRKNACADLPNLHNQKRRRHGDLPL
ncbi:hypothetical protein U1Q18_046990, partial [Sarracenia purpurea var. burkii]